MKRIRGGTFFARIEHCSQKLWPEVNSKVHVSKVCFPALSRVMKVPNHVVNPNKGAEGALTARGVLLVSIPTLCYPAILCFTFLFTGSLSTLHCLGQVLSFSQNYTFCKTRDGNETIHFVQKMLHLWTFCASHRKVSHHNVNEFYFGNLHRNNQVVNRLTTR